MNQLRAPAERSRSSHADLMSETGGTGITGDLGLRVRAAAKATTSEVLPLQHVGWRE